MSKPLLVSCGADCTVRVWDYRAWQCQLVSSQPEGPLGVALHPDGMQLLLAFKEKLRAYHIGISTLLPWREFDLAARQVCYASLPLPLPLTLTPPPNLALTPNPTLTLSRCATRHTATTSPSPWIARCCSSTPTHTHSWARCTALPRRPRVFAGAWTMGTSPQATPRAAWSHGSGARSARCSSTVQSAASPRSRSSVGPAPTEGTAAPISARSRHGTLTPTLTLTLTPTLTLTLTLTLTPTPTPTLTLR